MVDAVRCSLDPIRKRTNPTSQYRRIQATPLKYRFRRIERTVSRIEGDRTQVNWIWRDVMCPEVDEASDLHSKLVVVHEMKVAGAIDERPLGCVRKCIDLVKVSAVGRV